MGANKATICIFNDDENIEKILNDLKNIDLNIQTLSQNQILVDGSEEYFVNAYKDETYSNLIQLVYKFGIMGALPEFHKEIRLAAENAISKKEYGSLRNMQSGRRKERLSLII